MKENILVPIITENEEKDVFIAELSSAGKIVLVFVIDQEAMGDVAAGFIGTKIKNAETIIEMIKEKLPSGVLIKDYVEWGSWAEKIKNISVLERIDQVVMKNSKEAEELVPKLENKGLKYKLV